MVRVALLLALVALSPAAFAGCEDGPPMAVAAAKKAAAKVYPGCRLARISEPDETPKGEDIYVAFHCGGRKLSYRVSLVEVEDAVCYVKSVKEAPFPHERKCPQPGTVVNCMPITTNPLCEGKTRRWVQKNCSGVRYLD